ncbi:MAG TPA: threonine--tRNA ligase [Conexivisphaerales archaeon]|nr:threonine--tRNA ligase [Conexivisphaerales archaeon]
MKVLLNHVDYIEYEPVAKEISSAEEADKSKRRLEELVVAFTAVESGDDEAVAQRAVAEIKASLDRLGVKRLLLYPYAHLSQDLAPPQRALQVLKAMEAEASAVGLETHRAPFGWNKAFELRVKGHPLAEQSKVFVAAGQPSAPAKQVRKRPELSEEEMLAKVKKSDFAGLPDTDHRVIGEKLDLFSFQEPSPGMVYWHDRGVKLRNLLMDYIRSENSKRGYIEISTPALANTVLWRVSGHWDHYKDNMFITHLGDEEFGLKPMNCPSTFLFYKTRKWSYRDLPLRVADFDQLYRNELSGVASGLFRVKVLTQDDAHLFVTEEQIEPEIRGLIDVLKKWYGIFNLTYTLKISTMPDDHIGSVEQWDAATSILRKVVQEAGIVPVIKEKEGAFYGPKIDVDIKDSLGREWQCATIQLDYQMPKRFKLTYVGADGADHTPIVIHRVIYGSLERFIGIITEHFQGKFPVWISPLQVRVITVSDDNAEYAKKVFGLLQEGGIRADADLASGTVGAKIRQAQLEKLPYMLVIGKKEQDSGTVSVRSRDGQVRYGVKAEDFLNEVRQKVKEFS